MTFFSYLHCSLSYLSGPESSFGEAWSSTVHFLAATRLPTNFNVTNNFQTGLPPRILLEGDKPFIGDFTLLQNKVLFLLESLHTTNKNTGRRPVYGPYLITGTVYRSHFHVAMFPLPNPAKAF